MVIVAVPEKRGSGNSYALFSPSPSFGVKRHEHIITFCFSLFRHKDNVLSCDDDVWPFLAGWCGTAVNIHSLDYLSFTSLLKENCVQMNACDDQWMCDDAYNHHVDVATDSRPRRSAQLSIPATKTSWSLSSSKRSSLALCCLHA